VIAISLRPMPAPLGRLDPWPLRSLRSLRFIAFFVSFVPA